MMPAPALQFSPHSPSPAPSLYLGAIEAFGALVTKLESKQAHQLNLNELKDLIRGLGNKALRLALPSQCRRARRHDNRHRFSHWD
jgi:hypothetical protein